VRTGGTVRRFPIRRRLLRPTITLLAGSLPQWTDTLALQRETHTRDARGCSPGGACRADGALRNTRKGEKLGKDKERGEDQKRGKNVQRRNHERRMKDEKRGKD